ncbi:MAG TPA: glycosyltransferase family A protein [Prosthecobacter sp.]
MPSLHGSAKVGVLIRFANSAGTLPGVLAALQNQTLRPNVILGVDSGSQDASPSLIKAAGGKVISWPHRYSHARVLNFGLAHLDTGLVLILSSHTILQSPDTLARMVEAMHDRRTACVSLKWDNDPFYSDAIDWRELSAKGLKFGSIYSNSMGMIRRSLWQRHPFDESLPTAEDYAWAVRQLHIGHICHRLHLPFHYQRSGPSRDYEFSRTIFGLARHHRLKVTWFGLRSSLVAWIKSLMEGNPSASIHRARLAAFCSARLSLT